jgi:hypothetical protein
VNTGAAAAFFGAPVHALVLAILYSPHAPSCEVCIIATQSWPSVVSLPAMPIESAVSAGETMGQLVEQCLVPTAATPHGVTWLTYLLPSLR